jgi:ubiquinone/menaquinone biosynthesis C-methylase UbiE
MDKKIDKESEEKKFYKNVDEEYYDKVCNSKNPVRKWFHRKRHEIVYNWVKEQNPKNKVIVDLACGSCIWNKDKLNVIGVDISERMLSFALKRGRIKKAINEDINKKVSLKSNYADIIILGDVVEHLPNYKTAIKEAKRIIKKKGIILCSVPYDTNLSLWKPLFNSYCLLQGYILGNRFYKAYGGHINHFSPEKIKKEFEKQGLKVINQFDNMRFTIYTIATKD